MTAYRPALAAVRGLAASSVAGSHVLDMAYRTTVFAWMGWLGVTVFLALSAYLLVPMLRDGMPLRAYFRRRIVRVWPLYWATCGAAFLLFDPSWMRLALNLAFVAIYVPSGQFPTHLAWSPTLLIWTIQVEEAAYLAFPLVAKLTLAGVGALGRGLVGASLAYYLLGQFGPWGSAFVFDGGYTLPFAWLAAYGAGLVALTTRDDKAWVWFGVPFAAFAAIPTMTYEVGILAAAPLAVAALRYPPTFLGWRPLVALGEVSYGLYMTHVFLLDAFRVLGAALMLPTATAVEAAQRGRTILRRLGGRA